MSRHAHALQRVVLGAGLGAACVVVGGLVAAAAAVAPFEHGSWLAAYLVLVAGVAQVTLSVGQATLAPRPTATRTLVVELIAWNTGNAAVVAGTLAGLTLLVDIGGALLLLTLVLLLGAVRGAGPGVNRTRRWTVHAFRLLVLCLLVSIPAGLWLARIHTH